MHLVKKHSTLDYAWDVPAARTKEILLHIGGKVRCIDIMEIGDLPPFKFPVSVMSVDWQITNVWALRLSMAQGPFLWIYEPKDYPKD